MAFMSATNQYNSNNENKEHVDYKIPNSVKDSDNNFEIYHQERSNKKMTDYMKLRALRPPIKS